MTKTRCGTLLDAEGLLCISQFEEVMRDQMKRFLQRQLTNTLAVQQFAGSEEVQLTIMKAILQEQVFPGKFAFSLDACCLIIIRLSPQALLPPLQPTFLDWSCLIVSPTAGNNPITSG